MTKTAHPVETDSSGVARLWALRLGDGTATGLNATEKLTVVGDGTQNSVTISSAASSLYALDIEAASTSTNAVRVTQTGAGRNALEIVGNGSNAAATFTGGGAGAITATSTAANAITGTALSGVLAGVRGTGAIGVAGDANTVGGTGVRGDTMSGATSSSEAVLAAAVSAGIGLRATAVDGNAVIASCTGEEDALVVLAAGDGAAVRIDPQSAAPAVDRAGQLWALDVDTSQTSPMWCGNATGLAQAQRYVWGGFFPLLSYMEEDDSTQDFAQGATNQTVLEVVVANPYAIDIPVRVSARATVLNDSAAGIPIENFSLHLFDATASTTMETDSFDLLTVTHRTGATIEELYSLPAATTTTLRLRISVGAGTALDEVHVSHAKLSVITVGGAIV